MICQTNKQFREVDSRLHKLKVQRLGKSPSLPKLDMKRQSIQGLNPLKSTLKKNASQKEIKDFGWKSILKIDNVRNIKY